MALVALWAAALAPPAAGNEPGDCPAASVLEDERAAVIRRAMTCLINHERSSRGLPVLRHAEPLERAAGDHARDMVRRGYFSHFSPGGSGPLQRAIREGYLRGARRCVVGENIGWVRDAGDMGWIVGAWLRSPSHRAALLSRQYRDLGVGIVTRSPAGDADGLTVVTDFGDRTPE